MSSIWIASGAIGAFFALIAAIVWLATRKGRAEERSRASEKTREIDEAMADEMARPDDPSDVVDRLRKHDF